MSKDVQDILQALEEYEKTCPASVGVGLRLDLAEIVLRNLRRKGWSQRTLARETGLKESYISRVLHSNANCTFETAGNLLFALGIRAQLEQSWSATAYTWTGSTEQPLLLHLESTDGQESVQKIRQETSTGDIAVPIQAVTA